MDAAVIIGGNGWQAGAQALSQLGVPVVGIASTIDNDLVGSGLTIGVDTALNVALEAIDRLKVTASSHHRAFLVEVMGRDCGYLALMAGIAGGAEVIVIPEIRTTPEEVEKAFAPPMRGIRPMPLPSWPKAPKRTPRRWRRTLARIRHAYDLSCV
jgi:6-phosphofructokinase 1